MTGFCLFDEMAHVACRAQHLLALGKNPVVVGKGGEEIQAFVHVVKENGIPREDAIKAAIRAEKDAEPRS